MTSGKSDELKGRIKEAAGVVRDDDELRREGKIERVAGKVKRKAEAAVDKVRDAAKGKKR